MVIAADRDQFPPTKGPEMPPALHCAASSPPPQRRLHNFTFPTATWGTQRFIRCSKFPPGSDTNAIGSVVSKANLDGCASLRRPHSLAEKTVPPAQQSDGDRYLNKEERKRAEKVTTGRSFTSIVAAAPAVEDARDASRPWNLRTRRAGCNAQVENDGLPSPLAAEKRCLQTEGANRRSDRVEDRHRQKFSLSLSREEIEQDFLVLKGTKPSGRPKKRPRIVRRQLNSLFPGLWLGEITPARYYVD